MLSVKSPSNLWISLVILLAVGSLSYSSLAESKPSWKDGGSTEGPKKGSGKGGGKNKTQPALPEITITEYPASLSVLEGEKSSFLISAISSDGQEITYQWSFNGQTIDGANASSFSIELTSISDQGDYSVSLNIVDVTKIAEASLNVEAEPAPAPAPELDIGISFHPMSQSVYIQESLTLNVSATGSGGLNYQWRKNGIELVGENLSHLYFDSLTIDDGALYDVIVSNETGSVASNVADITVKQLASIALSWDTPTAREDGSLLSPEEIDSYNVYISIEGDLNEEVINVPGTLNDINLDEVFRGTYQFAIATIDVFGGTGNRSEPVSIIIN